MYDELSKDFAQCNDEQKEIIMKILSKMPNSDIYQARDIANHDTCISRGILYWDFFIQLKTRSELYKDFIQQVPDTHNAHWAVGECVHNIIMKM